MEKGRTPAWLRLILVCFALLIVAIPGMWVYMSVTAPLLHSNPQTLPAIVDSVPPPEWAAAVEQARHIVRARLSEENLPGISVAVGIGNDLVWAEGFGFADLKASQPVTPNHRFRIGTASIVLTSAAAGLLLEDGRLRLDQRIQTYVPSFPEKQWPVTLREVMGHTAGLTSDGGDESSLFGQHCGRPLEATPHFSDEPLRFEPGTDCRYSNYGWILVSAAIEAAAGQPFLTFMRERVFDPLGMRETIADTSTVEGDDDFPLFNFFRERIFDPRTKRQAAPAPAKKPMDDVATSYFPRFSADPKYGLHLMRPLDLSCYAGASAFLSTPSDLVRFGMAIHGGKLLEPATVQLLQASQRLGSGKDTGYGLGWDIENIAVGGKQTRVVGHDGALLGGMVASLITLPEQAVVVAVISNISYAGTFSLAGKVAEAFVEQGRKPAGK